MHTAIKRQIIALAHATPDVEICGFIYYDAAHKLGVYPCVNVANDPANEFEISPDDYIKADRAGVLVGVYHSHPGDDEAFSAPDLDYIEEHGVPLYLYTVGTGRWQEYIPPTHHIDLVGLPFIWGLYDCYSIVRNGLRQDKKVYINDYDRDEGFAQDNGSKGLIVRQLAAEGVAIVGRGKEALRGLRPYDVILFNTESVSRVLPVHFGLFIGDSTFLHHPENHLSVPQQLNGHWINRINMVIRHSGVK